MAIFIQAFLTMVTDKQVSADTWLNQGFVELVSFSVC